MAQPAHLGLTALDVTLDDFSTLGKAPARYTLKTAWTTAARSTHRAISRLPGKNADAKLALERLAAAAAATLYGERGGRADHATARSARTCRSNVDWSKPEPSIQVGAGDVSLKSLKLVPNGNDGADRARLRPRRRSRKSM